MWVFLSVLFHFVVFAAGCWSKVDPFPIAGINLLPSSSPLFNQAILIEKKEIQFNDVI